MDKLLGLRSSSEPHNNHQTPVNKKRTFSPHQPLFSLFLFPHFGVQGQQRWGKKRSICCQIRSGCQIVVPHTHTHTHYHPQHSSQNNEKNSVQQKQGGIEWEPEGLSWWSGREELVVEGSDVLSGSKFWYVCWVVCGGGCGEGSSLILNEHHARCLLPEPGLRLGGGGDQLHHHLFACGHIDSSQAVGSDMTAGYVWARLPAWFLHRQRRWGWWLGETLWVCLVFHRANTHAPIYQINEMKSRR